MLINLINHLVFECFTLWSSVSWHVWYRLFHPNYSFHVLFVTTFCIKTVEFRHVSVQWWIWVLFTQTHLKTVTLKCWWSVNCFNLPFFKQVCGEELLIFFSLHFFGFSFANKWMFEGLISSDSELWPFLDHSFEEIKSIRIEFAVLFLVKVKVTSSIMSQNITVSCALKDRFVQKQVMEDDSDRKYITDSFTLKRHVPDVDNFGSHKTRSATSDKKILFLISVCRKPKVTNSNFQRIPSSKHDIFRLKVSMNDPFCGQMADAI